MLPEELIFEILLRLPVKSLVRFKSVCKNWKLIITNPKFTKLQSSFSKKRYDLVSSHVVFQYRPIMALHLDLTNKLYTNNYKLVPMASKYFKLNLHNSNFVGSCNGILCIHLLNNANDLCLWNPTIDEARYITFPNKYKYLILFSGFGYAPSIDDYKIVLAVQYMYERRRHRSIIVYSVRRGQWKELDDAYCSSAIPHIYTQKYGGNFTWWAIRSEPVVLDDALHWVIGNHHNNADSVFFILRFDMVSEYFNKAADLRKIMINQELMDYTNIGNKTYELLLKQTEIGLTEDNKIGVYQLYNEYYNQDLGRKPRLMREVVEVRVMLDQDWKMKYRYQGKWGKDNVDQNLQSITGNGKVVVMESSQMQNGKLPYQILDLSQPKPKPYFIHVAPNVSNGHPGHTVVFMANYVPTLISPNSFSELFWCSRPRGVACCQVSKNNGF